MSSKTQMNPIMDARQELILFMRLDDAVRRVISKNTDISKDVPLQAVIDACSLFVSEQIDDEFMTAWKRYSGDVVPKVRDLLRRFMEFREQSKMTAEVRKDLSVEEIDQILALSNRIAEALKVFPGVHDTFVDERRKLDSFTDKTKVTQEAKKRLDTAKRNVKSVSERIKDSLSSIETILFKFYRQDNLIATSNIISRWERTPSEDSTEHDATALRDDTRNKLAELNDKIAFARQTAMSTKTVPSNQFSAFVRKNPTLSDDLLNNLLTIPYIYNTLGVPLVGSLEGTKRTLKMYVSSKENDDSTPELSQQAKAALSTIDAITSKLMLSVNDEKRIPEIDDAVNRTLNNITLGRAIQEYRPLPGDTDGSGSSKRLWASVNKAATSSSSSPAAAAFMYRTVDPIRVVQYMDQIKRFRDTISKAEIGSQIAMHSKRLDQVNQELVRQAAELRARMDPAAGTPDDVVRKNIAEASVRIRQLTKQKKTILETYIRSVRSAVNTYAKQVVAFVQQKHGSAIRYMAYWEQVGKEGVASPELRDVIRDHNQIVMEIGGMCRQMLMEHAYVPFQKAINAMLHDTDVTVLSLDDTVVMTFETERDKTLLWIEKQADKAENAFLRGSPTLLDELFEPQQLVLWALKALRIGVAAVSIDVAKRAYDSVYKRRVQVLDQSPPGPALFVVMFLAVDAVAHLLVMAVLFTLYKMFKAPDNSFPIDMDLISRWSLDYAMCTAMILVLSVAIGYIIQNKRYFRFRHEGDRAIRAFAKMVLYIYIIAVFIPFYRLTYG